ncbi:aromatic acid exporter family protein [Streptomyces sp. NPDC005706]|uniref:aromatic acid exporter family protein n=1 Tax=Streptomyces sp. NPDC005706 TaxID=3157169 RepID=UPI0033D3C3E5
MLTPPAPVVDLVRRRRESVVVRTLRSTAAAALAHLAGLWLSGNAQPLPAPVTAVRVVQVTLYATLTLGIQRVAGVVAGVLIAVGFANAVGLTWWSRARRRHDRTTLGGLLRSLRSGELRGWWGGRMDPSRSWSFGRSGR